MTKGQREALIAEVSKVEIDKDSLSSWQRQQRDGLRTGLTQLVGKFGVLDVAGKEKEMEECATQIREAQEMISFLNAQLGE